MKRRAENLTSVTIDLRKRLDVVTPTRQTDAPGRSRPAAGAILRDERLEIAVTEDGQVVARVVSIGRR